VAYIIHMTPHEVVTHSSGIYKTWMHTFSAKVKVLPKNWNF
jgi:hypothetical protein